MPTSRTSRPGRLHACEPEGEDDLLAGALYERAVLEENEVPSLRAMLHDAVPRVPSLKPIIAQATLVAACDNPLEADGQDLLIAAARKCLEAGLDVYASETRFWAYSRAVSCDYDESDCECPPYTPAQAIGL
jgi:hypothetical protein